MRKQTRMLMLNRFHLLLELGMVVMQEIEACPSYGNVNLELLFSTFTLYAYVIKILFNNHVC